MGIGGFMAEGVASLRMSCDLPGWGVLGVEH